MGRTGRREHTRGLRLLPKTLRDFKGKGGVASGRRGGETGYYGQGATTKSPPKPKGEEGGQETSEASLEMWMGR